MKECWLYVLGNWLRSLRSLGISSVSCDCFFFKIHFKLLAVAVEPIMRDHLSFNLCRTWLLNFLAVRHGWKFSYPFKRGTFMPHTHIGWKIGHPWLWLGETFTVYTMGENSPMTLTWWNLHCVRHGWEFTHDFDLVKLSQCTPWVRIHWWLWHGETFTVYTMGENSPMTLTWWNLHCVHHG